MCWHNTHQPAILATTRARENQTICYLKSYRILPQKTFSLFHPLLWHHVDGSIFQGKKTPNLEQLSKFLPLDSYL